MLVAIWEWADIQKKPLFAKEVRGSFPKNSEPLRFARRSSLGDPPVLPQPRSPERQTNA